MLRTMSNQSFIVRVVAVLAMCMGASAAGAQATPPPAPALGAGTATAPAPAEAPMAQSALTSADAEHYIIGPGDVMQVYVWRSPELTTSIPVRPDGKISTPLVEDMVAVGKTPTQLARDVEKVLSEFIRSPNVTIIITGPASMYNQVKVVGQVRQPKPLPYHEGMTVLDALLAVGGLSEFAAGNRAKILREENGKQREIKLRAEDLVYDGDLSQNLPVRPGDVIVVPESRW
jgi:polysaccharide export outer membrane protein